MKLINVFAVMLAMMVWPAFAEKTFSELGREMVLEKFVAVKSDLEVFSFNTDWKATKKLRKDIGNLKLLLDVFAHVYPKKGLGEKDSWEYLREELDVGYEVFGNYKDVYDTSQTTGDDIDESEKEELYQFAISWTDDFLDKIANEDIFFYLEDSSSKLTKRKRSDLPKYIWRRLDFGPKTGLTGVQNLQNLIEGLLKLGEDDLEELYAIKNLTKYENEETFHDWRKGLRNVLKLNAFFPQVSFFFGPFQEDLNTLELAIDKFGDLNDLLVVYHKKGSKKVKKQVNREWKELKKWLGEQEMADVLENLGYAIEL